MWNPQLVRLSVGPLFLLLIAPGCQAFHSGKPASIRVQDIETKAPIPGAKVWISYPSAPTSAAPGSLSGTTSDDGTVSLQIAPREDAGITVTVDAPNYLSEEKFVPMGAMHGIEPPHLPGKAARGQPNIVVEMYAEPWPTVEFVLPAGYRGLAKIEVQPKDDAPCLPGQRCFTCEVSSSGEGLVSGPRVLERVQFPNFRARFTDGALLSREVKDGEVGLWCLKHDGTCWTFIVGTRYEYDCLAKSTSSENPKAGRSSSGGQGGRGRRHRGGGNTSSDPGMPGL